MAEKTAWHKNETFWETFQDFIFPPEKIDEASEQLDKLLELGDIEAGATVLDVPCGVGRHAVDLADRGYNVTAVDATTRYLEEAKKYAQEANVEVDFFQDDMREFRRENAFDVIFNLYTSFGYFESREDDVRTLRNFHTSLMPDGKLVMSLTSKEVLAGKFEEQSWHEQDDKYILEERTITQNWSWMENKWIVVGENCEMREFAVSHRLYSAFELTELLEDVGFSDTTVYGDLDGGDFDQTAEKLVIVAEK